MDVGGTFTDAVLTRHGEIFTAKVATTPSDQSEGVMAAIGLLLAGAGLSATDVTSFAHGMTVATNALLTESGARTALLATAGFTDVIEIARQTRPRLYQLCEPRAAPLVSAELRFPVRERITPQGVLEPLDERVLAQTLEELAGAEPESVAVSLLHSYADPAHERKVAAALAERLPDVHVSLSSEVLNVFREYERSSTTVIDAYLAPRLRGYLEHLVGRASRASLPQPEIMQSSGGLMSAEAAARNAARTVLSGPAAGTVGAAYLGSLSGDQSILSFDMGGTSCDVSVIDRGRARQTAERTIGGRVLQLPTVDVHTIGAGGGSVSWADAGGALRVGPRSAGAEPGPACYGRGGNEPTVTDANLLLGYLGADSTLAGSLPLDSEAAERAVDQLARRLALDRERTAAGIVRVADQEMTRALRVVTVARGVDPRSYALMAFGGAGPMHAARLAEELGIARVLCPRTAGVLSALGLTVSDRRRDLALSVLMSGDALTRARIAKLVEPLAERARKALPQAAIETRYELRYRGQAFELEIDGPPAPDPAFLRERFDEAHRQRYGYADPVAELELVNVRVAAVATRAKPVPALASSGHFARSRRRAYFEGEWLEAEVFRGEPSASERIDGPAICERSDATIVVPPRWGASVTEHGTLVLERAR